MLKKILITCDEATKICDKIQYKEATYLERFKFTLHFIVCSFCARYSKQNKKITSLLKIKSLEYKTIHQKLSEEDKKLLKSRLKEVEVHS